MEKPLMLSYVSKSHNYTVVDLSGMWIVRQTRAGGWKRVCDKAEGGWTFSQIKTFYFPNDPCRFV